MGSLRPGVRAIGVCPQYPGSTRKGGREGGALDIVERQLSHEEVRDQTAGSNFLDGAGGERVLPQSKDLP